MRDRDAEHLSARQRTFIRYSHRSDIALMALYGVGMDTIRRVRVTKRPNHPARMVIHARRPRFSFGSLPGSLH